MDPQLGRFVSADPTVSRPEDPQDFNRYAYCRNNPIRFVDPTGMSWLSKNFKKIFKAVLIVIAIILIVYAIAAIFQAMALASAGGGAAGGAGGVGGVAGTTGGTTAAGGGTLGASGTTAAGEAVAHMAVFTAPAAPVASGETIFLLGSGIGSGAGAIMMNTQAKQPISDRKMPEVKIDVPNNWPDPNYTYGAGGGNQLPFLIGGGGGIIGSHGKGGGGATVPAISVSNGTRALDVNQGRSLEKAKTPKQRFKEGIKKHQNKRRDLLKQKSGDPKDPVNRANEELLEGASDAFGAHKDFGDGDIPL